MNLKKIIIITMLTLIIFNPCYSFSLMDAINKVKDKYFNWVPSWHEVAFIVNAVSIYTKVRDIVYNMAYQIRLTQSTIRLINRQAEWFKRTKGMMEKMRSRGFTLYDIEMMFRDIAYLTGPHYQYLIYLSGRSSDNVGSFFGAMGFYLNPHETTFEQRMAANSAVFGDPNNVTFEMLSKGKSKLPLIYEANLAEISDADGLIAHSNHTIKELSDSKKDIFEKLSDMEENLNNSKIIQQIALANIKRAQLKVRVIDIMSKRNSLHAYRILTKSHLLRKSEIIDKYKTAGQVSGAIQ